MAARSSSSPAPERPPRDLPLVVVVLGVAASAVATVLVGARTGATALAGVLALAALGRAVLPVRRAGSLAVRSRPVDVLVLTGLAVVVAVLARIVPGA